MWIGVISLLPELLEAGTSGGVFSRAVSAGIIEMLVFNPRDYADDRHRTVDDKPYGGGAGMVMMNAPLLGALRAAKGAAPEGSPVVLMSPQGQVFTQQTAIEAGDFPGLIIVCGRYEGVDERFVQRHIDQEWSIGDYVLSGGELPALVVMDAIARHIPGTLGNSLSIIDESHLDGTLDYPHYTRPVEYEGAQVPSVLLSGNHTKVKAYRRREALGRTFDRRPDLLATRVFSEQDRKLLKECFAQRQNTTDRNEA
jgi:tRNA (guanine37-N1)-methyltransferase